MRADLLIRRLLDQHERPVGVSGGVLGVVDPVGAKPDHHDRTADRLNHVLPEALHLQRRQHAQQIDLIVLGVLHSHRQRARRMLAAIGVGHAEIFAPRLGDAVLHGVGLAEPSVREVLDVDQPQPAVFVNESLNDRARLVLAAIVADDDLEVGVVLGQHRTHAGLDVVGFILGGDDHGDHRRLGRRAGVVARQDEAVSILAADNDVAGNPYQTYEDGDDGNRGGGDGHGGLGLSL